ncbi:MAG: M20/M25/M40 family metallo-hydrolase, partial [Pyrinomonadaceae bacterium]|nr:M20/M25/M40 family metallo-hydrolase [Pyrinomonadaceae bacterium]
WGISNPRLEPWGTFGNGWSIENYSVEMISPSYDRIAAMPLAWSPSTDGVVSGEPMVVTITSEKDFAKYRGKLKGAIVLDGSFPTDKFEDRFNVLTKRFKDGELAENSKQIDPLKGGQKYIDEQKGWETYLKGKKAIIKFLRDEGVGALIQRSSFKHGVVRAAGYYETNSANNVPAFVISREQYARIIRLKKRKVTVQLKLSLNTKFHSDTTGYNLIAEIPGTDPKLKDEIVLLGGHFDSWHGGTGAVDNAAGCIAMMEAVRILKAIGAKPRRTIRIALWSGEEQDYFGSFNYVKKHYGDPKTKVLKTDHEKLSAYFNLDNGSGKIRGVYLQGNESARPIFEAYLKPFNYLGAKSLTSLNTGGTDHMVFDAVGLPGFQFIQDPLDYSTRAHHSNLDVLEAVNPDDIKINSVIVASFAYHTAMRDERIPRK